jgi:hypothetical protein
MFLMIYIFINLEKIYWRSSTLKILKYLKWICFLPTNGARYLFVSQQGEWLSRQRFLMMLRVFLGQLRRSILK